VILPLYLKDRVLKSVCYEFGEQGVNMMRTGDLLNLSNWVVVGDVENQSKFAYRILKKLESRNFNVKGVNPKGGESVYTSLKDVPYKIDVIDLCINPLKGIKIIQEAKTLGIQYILIQPGAESIEILNYCKENNLTAIEGCVLIALG